MSNNPISDSSNSLADKIKELSTLLNQANQNYYNAHPNQLSDKEFDEKLKELESLEKANPHHKLLDSPTLRVGSDLNESFEKFIHEKPMLPISNT